MLSLIATVKSIFTVILSSTSGSSGNKSSELTLIETLICLGDTYSNPNVILPDFTDNAIFDKTSAKLVPFPILHYQ